MADTAPKTGMAFSGGGIRSAAFCSGVLRRILQRGVTTDYLSCVSGGGYTGTAYLDWKFRHDQRDDPAWHKKFFERMRRAAIFCNWANPVAGCCDLIILLFLVIFVAVVAPALVMLPYACPVAYLVDYFIGAMLRSEEPCPGGVPRNAAEGAATNDTLCIETPGSGSYEKSEFFASLLGLAVLFFLLGNLIRKVRQVTKMLMSACLGILVFAFLPWFTHEYLSETPFWMKGLVFFLGAVVWFSAPMMRDHASLIIIVFIYSYVIYWRVYKSSFVGLFAYSDRLFTVLLIVSGIDLWLAAAVLGLQQRLVHLYNRWRLQNVFYTDASTGTFGCRGITMGDCFLTIPDYERQSLHPDRPLTLADLQDMRPQYICNTVVNKWQRTSEDQEYELLTMTPTRIERLDCAPGEDELDSLIPRDIRVSEAMTTSAAVVSRHMGAYEETGEAFRDLQMVLGIAMGAELLTDPRAMERDSIFHHVLPFFIGFVQVLPLIVFPVLHLAGMKKEMVTWGVFIFVFTLGLLAMIAVMPVNNENPGLLSKALRWTASNVAHVRNLRSLLAGAHHGSTAPPILSLSDGGHIENLGLLPLLKMRLKKIVVADGGFHEKDSTYGEDLIIALNLSRKKLRCSFLGMDGRDVVEDVRAKFVEKAAGKQPRSYKFKVRYYEKHTDGEEELVGEGEILLIAPRHPQKGVMLKESVTWKEALGDIDVDLETGLWGEGPNLEADEVDRLTFCCCDCCHCLGGRRFSKFMCGTFPQHATANQLFTSDQFSAYHREGYRACLEAEAAEFLLAE